MIDRVLVALDGSRNADAALDFALDVAAHCDAVVCLQHVMTSDLPTATQLERVEGLPPKLLDQLQQPGPKEREVRVAVGREILARAERQAAALGLTRVHTRLDDGAPVQEILAYADRENVDLIVTGSRGLGLVREVLIGSVSGKLLHLATRPCCIVKLPREPRGLGKLQQLT